MKCRFVSVSCAQRNLMTDWLIDAFWFGVRVRWTKAKSHIFQYVLKHLTGTHIMVQEVLDGSVHVCWDVGTPDLTHGQTQTPPHHCRYHGNHLLTLVVLLPAAGSDPGGCASRFWRRKGAGRSSVWSLLKLLSLWGTHSFISGGTKWLRPRVERERSWW